MGRTGKDPVHTEGYQDYLNQIRSFHFEEGPRVDWLEIRKRKSPYDPKGMGPEEMDLRSRNPQISEEELLDAQRRDCVAYRSYERIRQLHDELYSGKIEACLGLIALMHPYDALPPWGMTISCQTGPGGCFEITCNLNEENLLPVTEQNLAENGDISVRKLTQAERMAIWREMAASVLVYLARRTFELLPLGQMSVLFVSGDGHGGEKTYLSAVVDRDEIMKKDFRKAELSSVLSGLRNCGMNFQFPSASGAPEHFEQGGCL